MRDEFLALTDACEIEKSLFNDDDWNALLRIMYAPEQFMATHLVQDGILTAEEAAARADVPVEVIQRRLAVEVS